MIKVELLLVNGTEQSIGYVVDVVLEKYISGEFNYVVLYTANNITMYMRSEIMSIRKIGEDYTNG